MATPEEVEGHDEPEEVEGHDEPEPAEEVIEEPAPPSKKVGAKKGLPPSPHASKAATAAKAGWPREVVVLGMVLSGVAGALVMDTLPRWSPRAAAALGWGQARPSAAPVGGTVELTLVAADRENLACATDAVIDGLHCGFGADGKPWAGAAEPAGTLQPFTTTDRRSILGAGLWDVAAMSKAKLPNKRFRAKCDFAAAGEAAGPKVRWAPGAFKDTSSSWPAGRLSNCKLLEG